jgi:type IV pilus assembly protein PilQ
LGQAENLTWPTKLRNPFSNDPSAVQTKIIVISLHFADPKIIKNMLTDKKNNLLSDNGFIVVQEKKRRILIEDTPGRLRKIKRIIAALDKPQQQLLLKARIVSVDEKYARDLGMLFASSQKNNGTSSLGAAMSTVGSFTMPIANLGNGQLLDVRLNALEKKGHANVVSSPEIVALNNEQATIESGDEVPYQQEAAYGATSVAFKKAVLKLQVTPHILSHQRILLNLQVNQDKVGMLTVKGVPAIHTQQLITQVELSNKQTFALGGIYETNRSDQVQGVPYLKDIPVLGYLFRTHHRAHEKREMLVFVTVDLLS